MDKEWIMREQKKWQDEAFLNEVCGRLNEQAAKIDVILYDRYSGAMRAWSGMGERAENAVAAMKKRLMDRNLIDEQGNLLKRENAVAFTDVDSLNGGTNTKGDILFNPKGAGCFYKSYIEFEEGKRGGIRPFDYTKDIKELPELTSAEALFWCYTHNMSYEEFTKMTLLHESVHKWTFLGGFFDDPSETELAEGMVEREARRIGEEHPELGYIPIFRCDDVKRAGFLEQYSNPVQYLCTSNAENFEVSALYHYYDGDEEKAFKVFHLIDEYVTKKHDPSQKHADFSKSLYQIFLERKPKSHEIIEIIESYKDKKIEDVDSHDDAGEER